MKQLIGAFLITGFALTASVASAQESGASAGRVEIGAFPGGGILFTESSSGPDFFNYALGGSFTYNFNRFVGVEGEGGGTFGIDQKLDFRGGQRSAKPPNTLAYNGNAIVYPTGNNRAFVPYGTGGVGGLTLFDRRQLGVNDTTTFLAGNVGGGVKYYLSADGACGATTGSSPSGAKTMRRRSSASRRGTVTGSSAGSCSACFANRSGTRPGLPDSGIRSRRRPVASATGNAERPEPNCERPHS